MCEIKSGLMKGRVRLSEVEGRREVDREGEKEHARGRGLHGERMLGGEGRHAKLCAKIKEIERLGVTEKLWLRFMCWGGNWRMGTRPKAPFQLGPRSHLRGETMESRERER